MAGTFTIGTDQIVPIGILPWTEFSTGDPSGRLNNPADFAAITQNAIDYQNDRDVIALTLLAGQSFTADIDNGLVTGGGVDTRITAVDHRGNLIAYNDDSGATDPGSELTNDPLITFVAPATGIYYIAVSHWTDTYVNASFSFSGSTSTTTGLYDLVLSTTALPPQVIFGPGADTVVRGNLPDRVVLGGGSDTANLGGGNDIADGGAGGDAIRGGDGDDLLYGDIGEDTLSGGNNDDVLTGGEENDTLDGDRGNDQLFGEYGEDTINGGDGDDFIDGGYQNDDIDGGAGNDTVSYAGDFLATIASLAAGTASNINGNDSIANVENLIGSLEADDLTGDGGDNRIEGGDGNDFIYGLGGDDVIVGGRGGDSMDGGGGVDTLSYETSSSGVRVWLTLTTPGYGDAAGDFIQNFENLTGSLAADELYGTDAANILSGLAGVDVLDGGGGNDIMDGGRGNDTYFVGQTGDVVIELSGGGETDLVLASANYVLPDNVENLNIFGSFFGTGNNLSNTILGFSGRQVIDGKGGADVMAGLEGDDIYVVDNADDQVDEVQGGSDGIDTIRTFISNAGALAGGVENVELMGTGNIYAVGNELANRMTGNSGNNILYASAGIDTSIGGLGNDSYQVNDIGDKIIELANQGHDRVGSFLATYTLTENVEDLDLSANESTGIGNALNNRITAAFGANLLDGRGGADFMDGFTGGDTYVVDDAGDVVRDGGGAGDVAVDLIRATVSFGLANTWVENLTLLGTDNIDAKGDGRANTLIGNGGRNRLDGLGGADRMEGKRGDDTYVVDNAGDVVVEDGVGTDLVLSAVSFVLGTAVENLTLTGGGNIDATGNGLANVLTGNGGRNRLDGLAGADTMRGDFGDDTYVVDNAGDRVTEGNNQGTDTVLSSVGFAAGAQHIENITLTGAAGINATGNAAANLLIGNSGNNRLDGLGGGDDMRGGLGNDTYVVDNALDKVAEGTDQGTDTVESSVTFAVGGQHIENVTLTGAANINATGNNLRNVLHGNTGSNVLTGGGLGDELWAGADNVRDVFVFAAAGDSGLSAAAMDTIFQFDRSAAPGDATSDRIDLSLLDADPDPGNQAFRFVSAFTTAAPGQSNGQVRVDIVGPNARVYIDLDGNNTADMAIAILNVTAISDRDFIL